MIYFTADWHLLHKNILKYEERPFKDVQVMANTLIKNHNNLVTPDDEVWDLGDFTMVGSGQRQAIETTIQKLNGHRHLILGNHDRFDPFTYVNMGYTSVHTAIPLYTKDYTFILCHDPSVYDCVKDKGILLCAHVHKLFKCLPEQRVINVGIDVWDYKPVSLDQILELVATF